MDVKAKKEVKKLKIELKQVIIELEEVRDGAVDLVEINFKAAVDEFMKRPEF